MKKRIHSGERTASRELPVRDPNRQLKERAERLRSAVQNAGGNKAVAERSSVPLGTLNTYLSGGEMKMSAAVALARACGVSLAWLATGEEPDASSPTDPNSGTAPAAPEGSASAESRLFSSLNISKFAEALDAVIEQLGGPRFRRPTHQVVQAAVLIYDLMQEPDEMDEVSVTKAKSEG